MVTGTWATLDAGEELDRIVTERMEPMPAPIAAHEARLKTWGAGRWVWSSSASMRSPGGWWEAEIGTDHGPKEADHDPVRWRPAREPSSDLADAEPLIEKLNADGWEVLMRTAPGEGASVWLDHGPTGRKVDDQGDTLPLALCRAALAATEAV